jgi:predicted cupin superfamily sugar epimerase
MTSGGLPVVHRIVLGSDIANGERTQLFVPGGWWKASEIPEEDLLLCSDGEAERGTSDKIGCLISEVVIPGWNIEQHQFIDENKVCWGEPTGIELISVVEGYVGWQIRMGAICEILDCRADGVGCCTRQGMR